MTTASHPDARPAVLGIDVGTTTVDVVLADDHGRTLDSAARQHPTVHPAPGWAEQRADDWWDGAMDAIAELSTRHDLSEVRAVGVCAQAPTLLPLDADGSPLRDALIWMDRRAYAHCTALAALRDPADLIAERGNRLDPFYVAPKIAWFAEAEPDLFERTRTFAQIPGVLALRMTGELSLDDQHATLYGLRPAGSTQWSPTALRETGIEAGQLPAVVPATSVVGGIRPAVAAQTGLPVGTPVIAGTVDSAAAAVDAGPLPSGAALEMTGTSSVVVMPTPHPRADPAFVTMSAATGGWYALAATVAAGAALAWIAQVGGHSSIPSLVAAATRSTPGAGGVTFLPYLAGERSPLWDSTARGAFLGLTLGTGQADLARAVMEGTAFALRHNLETAEVIGLSVSSLVVAGRPSLNDLWCQMRADVTRRSVTRVETVGAGRGAAILAAVGTGILGEVSDAQSPPLGRTFEPDLDAADRYDEAFDHYLSAARAVAPEAMSAVSR